MKRLLAIAFAILAAALLSARAQSPDDQYVRIYTLIQQADALNEAGQTSLALEKYLEAQSSLKRLQKVFPDWSSKVVSFRLNYLEGKVNALTTKAPATPTTVTSGKEPAKSRSPETTTANVGEADRKLAALEEQVRQLQDDKTVLEAKVKEALATQPAAIDPRELTKAQEQIQSLMKENDLLKLAVAKQQTEPASGADQKILEEDTKRALAVSNEAAEALRAENEILKKQVSELQSRTATDGGTEQKDQLAQIEAKVTALQSEANVLRLEKTALQNRITEISAGGDESARRIKQLESERDDLQKQLAATEKGGFFSRRKKTNAKIKALSQQVESYRARLEVLEAQTVPYTAEELALLQKPVTELTASFSGTDSSNKSSKEPPKGTTALAAEAQRLFATKQYDKAEQKYLEMLRQDKDSVYTLANLAAIQLEMGRLDEAEKHVRQSLTHAPDDAYSLSILGYLKFRQEKYDDAFTALSRAGQLDPKNAEIQNYLGVVLSHKGMREPAETALRKAIQIEPNYSSAHNNLAVIYATQRPPLVGLARWHYQKARAAGHPRNEELEKILGQESTNAAPIAQ